MAGPSRAGVRRPAVAGLFYPGSDAECREAAARLVRATAVASGITDEPRRPWVGGMVPHAGWVCSGAIAGETIGTIARSFPDPDVVVIFGAVHTPIPLDAAVLSSHAQWQVPGGTSTVPAEMAAELEA